jgi:hypothetical protein
MAMFGLLVIVVPIALSVAVFFSSGKYHP